MFKRLIVIELDNAVAPDANVETDAVHQGPEPRLVVDLDGVFHDCSFRFAYPYILPELASLRKGK